MCVPLLINQNPLLTSAKVFGRAEMFIFSISVQILGFILYASCQNIGQYEVSIWDDAGTKEFQL